VLNTIFTEDIILHDSFLNTDILLRNGQFSAMVVAPWRRSNTARNFIIINDNDNNKKYILTSIFSFSGNKLLNNPYIPPYWEKEAIKELLVSQSGDVKSVKHERLPYFWAPFIEHQCILDIDNIEKSNVISDFSKKYLLLNKKAIHTSKQCLEAFNESCFSKIKQSADMEFLKNMSIRIKKKLPNEFIASWSHGDLWEKDIFIKEKGFTVIDWEWCTLHAPAGMDILDLMSYNMWPNWELLLNYVLNSNGDEKILHNMNFFDETTRKYKNAFNIFFIYRTIMRVVAQEGVCRVMKNKIYQNMIKYIN
jgi:hypothetical protein